MGSANVVDEGAVETECKRLRRGGGDTEGVVAPNARS
jgi:hypothetical protein